MRERKEEMGNEARQNQPGRNENRKDARSQERLKEQGKRCNKAM